VPAVKERPNQVKLPSPPAESPAEQAAEMLARLPAAERADAWAKVVAAHPDPHKLLRSWRSWWARPEQLAPGTPGAALTVTLWRWWCVVTGRGWGKTRTAAEWVLDRCELFAREAPNTVHRVSMIAPTRGDGRDVMVEGESGIMACAERRGWVAHYEPSKTRVTIKVPGSRLPTICRLLTAEKPDGPRGSQSHTSWAEELAAWPQKIDTYGNTCLTNVEFALRLPCPEGIEPQGVITTTPKPLPEVRRVIDAARDPDDPAYVLTRGALWKNLRNLARSFVQDILDRYSGTRLGSQEIDGALLDVVEGALWTPDGINAQRVPAKDHARILATIDRIVVAVDPPGADGSSRVGAECGILVVGADTQLGVAYTLEDATVTGPPEKWGAAVVSAYHRHGADVVIGEVNYGGDMVRATIHAVDGTIPFKPVRAKRNKQLRAEPVATLADGGRARHLGYFGDLESQQVSWVLGEKSPDRLDAYVYAVTHLLARLTTPPASTGNPNKTGRRAGRGTPRGRPGSRPR
jgi:phage terminase large subunit-like protein